MEVDIFKSLKMEVEEENKSYPWEDKYYNHKLYLVQLIQYESIDKVQKYVTELFSLMKPTHIYDILSKSLVILFTRCHEYRYSLMTHIRNRLLYGNLTNIPYLNADNTYKIIYEYINKFFLKIIETNIKLEHNSIYLINIEYISRKICSSGLSINNREDFDYICQILGTIPEVLTKLVEEIRINNSEYIIRGYYYPVRKYALEKLLSENTFFYGKESDLFNILKYYVYPLRNMV